MGRVILQKIVRNPQNYGNEKIMIDYTKLRTPNLANLIDKIQKIL